MEETQVWSLGQEDPLETFVTISSFILGVLILIPLAQSHFALREDIDTYNTYEFMSLRYVSLVYLYFEPSL